MLAELIDHPQFFHYASIPIIAAVVGWATNWVAIQLTFYPIKKVGVGRFLGWQGVIPRKSKKMAAISVDRTLSRFDDMHSVFMKLEPELITHQILSQTIPRIEEYIDEIMIEHHAVLWDNLPYAIKNRLYDWGRSQLPKRIEALVADFGEELGELVDLQELFVEELHNHPELMVKIFRAAGEKELKFIVKSGLFFGALLGVVIAVVWQQNTYSTWLLPFGGFVVGFLTNWLALNCIFRPLNPRYIFGMKFQGVFLKRQSEVSKIWSQMVAEELMTVEKVSRSMVFGRHSHRTRAIIQKHIRPVLDQAGILKLITQVTVGTSGYAEIKKALHEKAISVSTEPFHDDEFNRQRAPIVAEAINSRMSALTPAEFQDVLRPAFQEEEWQLMLIGGVLGMVAGGAQWLLFF